MAEGLMDVMKSNTLSFTNYPTRELTDFDLQFIKSWIGEKSRFNDVDILKSRIEAIHKEIRSQVHVYSCISSFSYLVPRARLHPSYDSVVKAAVAVGPAYKILDVGSCLGQETRALIVDGVHPSSIWTSDVHNEYWKAGIKVFMDDETRDDEEKLFSVSEVNEIWGDWTTPLTQKFVGELKNHFDAILCKNVLHALSLQQSENLLTRLFKLLKNGGILFGTAVGRVSAREWVRSPTNSEQRWLFDQSSLETALRNAGFSGEIIITATVEKIDYAESTAIRSKIALHPDYVELMKDRRYLVFSACK